MKFHLGVVLISVCIVVALASALPYRDSDPVDIPVRIVYDDNNRNVAPGKQHHQKVYSKSSGLVYQSHKNKGAAVRAVEESVVDDKQKESNVQEVFVNLDGTEVADDRLQALNEEEVKQEVVENNDLRTSEDHPAQIPIAKADEIPTPVTQAPSSPLASLQQAFSNAIETIRPSNVAQAVINRLQPNRTQSIPNDPVIESSNPNPQAAPAAPSPPASVSIQQAITSALDSIRPSNVAQAVINRLSPNRTESTTPTNASSSPGPLASLQQQFVNVLNRFTTPAPPPSAPQVRQGTPEPGFVQNIQTNVNGSIDNFREQVNNAINSWKPTPAPGAQSDEQPPPNEFLENLQQNFNDALDGFSNNINGFLNNFNQQNPAPGAQNDAPGEQGGGFFQNLQSSIQSNLQQFTQSFAGPDVQNDQQQPSEGPWGQIVNGFQSFVSNLNGVGSQPGAQNDQPQNQNQNPFQGFFNQFRPSSSTPSPSNNPSNPISSLFPSNDSPQPPNNNPAGSLIPAQIQGFIPNQNGSNFPTQVQGFIPQNSGNTQNPSFIPQQAQGFIPNQNGSFIPQQAQGFIPNQNGSYIPAQAQGFIPNQNGSNFQSQIQGFIPQNSGDSQNPSSFIPQQAQGFIPNQNGSFIPQQAQGFIPNQNSSFIPQQAQGFIPQSGESQNPGFIQAQGLIPAQSGESNQFPGSSQIISQINQFQNAGSSTAPPS